jgi:predicted RNase H-like HicB family nuclease
VEELVMLKKYNLSLIFYPQDTGDYHVECPELPGCFTCADTIEEATEIMKELIPEYLDEAVKRDEEMFRLGHCLPGKVFHEIEVAMTDSGETIFPSLQLRKSYEYLQDQKRLGEFLKEKGA